MRFTNTDTPVDELALMFTGSKAMTSQITSTTSTIITEDDEGSVPLPTSPDPGTEPRASQNSPTVSSDQENTPEPRISSHSGLEVEAPLTALTPTSWTHPNLYRPFPDSPPHPLFTTEQLGVDRRLLVNRKRQLKMYRVWMQGKFRKIAE